MLTRLVLPWLAALGPILKPLLIESAVGRLAPVPNMAAVTRLSPSVELGTAAKTAVVPFVIALAVEKSGRRTGAFTAEIPLQSFQLDPEIRLRLRCIVDLPLLKKFRQTCLLLSP